MAQYQAPFINQNVRAIIVPTKLPQSNAGEQTKCGYKSKCGSKSKCCSKTEPHLGQIKVQQNRMYLQPVHIALTKHGKLLVVAGSGNDDKGLVFQAALFDPQKNLGRDLPDEDKYQHALVKDWSFRNQITVQYKTDPPHPLDITPPPDYSFNTDDMPPSTKGLGYDMFGNGFGVLEDCHVLIISGVEIFDIFKSTTRCAMFDPETEEFMHAPTLRIGRWYPTATTLPSGHIFTIGGLKGTKDSIRYNSTNNTNTDIFDPYAIDYDRGDNLVDPATKDYRPGYPDQKTRRNGTGDTAEKPMVGKWMTHSLAQLVDGGKNGPNHKCNGKWVTNDQNTELNAPGAFVPGPYQRYNISADICGSDKANADPECSYHGTGTEPDGAADGQNYDLKGCDYSPLHNDAFTAVSANIRTSHLENGTPLFQSAVAEDAEQPRVDMYPRQHLLKDGSVFISGWDKESWTYHPHVNKYDNHQDAHEKRIFGTSILLPLLHDDKPFCGAVPYRERVFILGGLPSYNRTIPASNTTEIIDLTDFEGQARTIPKNAVDSNGNLKWQQWKFGPSFNDALGCNRVPNDKGEMVQQNATILPDGTVFIQGGSRIDEIIPVGRMETFIYTPDSGVGTLKRGPDVKIQRQYHGTTLLLPDGTVGIYGGNPLRGYHERDIEIYEPTYLFDKHGNRIPENKRPKICGLKGTPDVKMSSMDKQNCLRVYVKGLKCDSKVTVSLVRLGAVTHAFNSEQRMVTAEVKRVHDDHIKVVMPVFHFNGYNNNYSHRDAFTPCPPGCYMLFVFVDGVPSRSKIIRLVRATGLVPTPHLH